ncbi:MAG: hypothetical protein HDR03_07490 [Lachnospiraceae bacterium]|nr:hypothetical protein [Lachnospiraceae bacterium]
MISVIVIWLYMIVTTFLLGYGILTGVTYLCPYRIKKWSSYLICGLAGATVYAQFFSIFAPVGPSANLLLSGMCLLIAYFCRKKLYEEFREIIHGQIKGKVFLILFLFLLYAYGTSRGIIHYDTGLYHAQSIRWIEEYGVVKGLGNLHCRLAYNSASFALSALYSMAFVTGQSFHCAAGFFALILASVCLELIDIFKRKYLKPSDFARVMGIYYLVNIFDEMISPASDYFMVLTAFYIIIRFMDLLEAEEAEVCPYAMLCVLSVFLMTLKLSAALIILLVIKPAVMLIKDKRWKEIALYISMGVLVAAPFLIRNVLLSGWLVYPFTSIDIFSLDWKIPKGITAYDAKEIQVWGRGYSDVTAYDMPIWKWLPTWFAGIGGMDKLFIPAAFVSVIVFIIRIAGIFVTRVVRNTEHVCAKKEMKCCQSDVWDKLLVEGVLSFSFIFWIVTSPLIRYGCVYVYLTPAVVFGDVLAEVFDIVNGENIRKYIRGVYIAVIGFFILYKLAALGKELTVAYVNDYWICQKDYDNYETLSYEIDGVTFYYPIEGDRTGYESFPSSPLKAQIRLRGDDIRDGFYYTD